MENIKDIRLKSAIEALEKELSEVQYNHKIEEDLFLKGDPKPFLVLLHFMFLEFSAEIANELKEKEFTLYAASDEKFLGNCFLILKFVYDYTPPLLAKSFFKLGFLEQKLELAINVIRLVKERAKTLSKQNKSKHQSMAQINSILLEEEEPEEPSKINERLFKANTFQSLQTKPTFNQRARNPVKQPEEQPRVHKERHSSHFPETEDQTNTPPRQSNRPAHSPIRQSESKSQSKPKDKHLILLESMNLISESVNGLISKMEAFQSKIEGRVSQLETKFENLSAEVNLLKNKINLNESLPEEPLFSFGENFHKTAQPSNSSKATDILSNAINRFEAVHKNLEEM